MGRKEATARGFSRTSGRRPAVAKAASRSGWLRPAKRGAVAAAILALLAIVAFAVIREASTPARGLTPPLTRAVDKPSRPAFTPAEEAYIRALWPIHGDVERSTVRLSLGQIFYKINDMDRSKLKARADEALATYQRSEARIRALEPPASVRHEHEEYLAAVDLFRRSAIEVLKMFADGRDDHLNAAYPMSQQASDKIREVGGKFWPNEFPPN
jgi:hypothetical protein